MAPDCKACHYVLREISGSTRSSECHHRTMMTIRRFTERRGGCGRISRCLKDAPWVELCRELILRQTWTMTHELVHMAISSFADEHHWLEEGLATYIEPIARAQDGQLPAAKVWKSNRKGLQDALRANVEEGATIDTEWPLQRVLSVGDKATGTNVLTNLYNSWKETAVPVNLGQLWLQVGVHVNPQGIA